MMTEQQLAEFLDNVPKMGIYGVPKPLRLILTRMMMQHWYNATHERLENVEQLLEHADREQVLMMIHSYKSAPFLNLLLRKQYDRVVNRHR